MPGESERWEGLATSGDGRVIRESGTKRRNINEACEALYRPYISSQIRFRAITVGGSESSPSIQEVTISIQVVRF